MNSPTTGKEMTRISRPTTMTVRGVEVPVAAYEVWRCEDSGEEFEDEEMVDANLAQAWAGYWASFALSDLLTMREAAVREISGIDRAIAGVRFSEKMEAVAFQIDREVLGRFERGQYPACFPGSQWWWHGSGASHIGLVTADEFDSIKRLTESGILKKENR